MRIARPARLILSFGAAATLAIVPACGDDDPSTEQNVAAVASYNVGLATGFVDYAPQREPIVAEVVAGLDADVVCLQEVWTQEQIDVIIAEAATGGFAHAYFEFLVDPDAGPPACSTEEAQPMRDCVDEKCASTPDSELAGCATEMCGTEFAALSDDCTTCLASNLGKPRDEIFQVCTTTSSRFSWGGHNGLLMLSKVPLDEREHHKLDSSLVQRSVLIASVELPRVGVVDVACTHLAADLSQTISYNGDYDSFEDEQIAQTAQMIDFLEARPARPRIVIGDMNSGPAIAPDIAAELPDAAYKTLVDAGYTSLAVSSAAPQCTYCASNLIIDDAATSVLIDHVFAIGLPTQLSVPGFERIGDQAVEIVDGNGATIQTHPSDHFGVRIQFDYQP